MRRRNWSKASKLPAAASPGTPFFSFFPFFSSLFFSFLAVENGEILLRCGVGERRSREQLRRRGRRRWSLAPGTTQPKTTLFWVGLIFFLNQNIPKRRRFGVTVFFLNQNTPKRRRFGVLFFKKKKKTTPPKRRRFRLPATKRLRFGVSQP